MIERLNEEMRPALVCNKFSRTTSKFHFKLQKYLLFTTPYLHTIKTFLTLERSQYSKSGSTFFSS